mmetsp:Transcript_11697/g.28712  ORF Transcript_11697/g.28712 Transcript_11697/m.28712 type:complete len:373 (+) Transcript_11697:1115-2233(+)
MLKPDGGERGDGQPDAHELAGEVLRGVSHPGGNAHQPVGKDALDKHLAPGVLHLVLRRPHRVLRAPVLVRARRVEQAHHDDAAQEVAAPRHGQHAQRGQRPDLALPHGARGVRAQRGVELRAAHHDGGEAKGEAHGAKQRAEHARVDIGRVGVGGPLVHHPADLQARGVAKAHVAARNGGQHHHLVPRELGLLLTVVRALGVDLGRRQDVGLLDRHRLERGRLPVGGPLGHGRGRGQAHGGRAQHARVGVQQRGGGLVHEPPRGAAVAVVQVLGGGRVQVARLRGAHGDGGAVAHVRAHHPMLVMIDTTSCSGSLSDLCGVLRVFIVVYGYHDISVLRVPCCPIVRSTIAQRGLRRLLDLPLHDSVLAQAQV